MLEGYESASDEKSDEEDDGKKDEPMDEEWEEMECNNKKEEDAAMEVEDEKHRLWTVLQRNLER